jgi:acyl carrier protein
MTDPQFARVAGVVSQVFDVPAASLTERSSSETIEAWTSLTHMNLVLALEDEFGVRLSDAEILEMTDLRAVMDTLARALSK